VTVVERIGDDWERYDGHVARYRYAARYVRPSDTVKDVACGVGYGATLVPCRRYLGYDKPEVTAVIGHPGQWIGCDLDDPAWFPAETDVALCFETLEHLADPARVAGALAESTRRVVVVSVPSVRSVGINPYHRHDLPPRSVPPLFAGFAVAQTWSQVDEQAVVWLLLRG
jgi:hypothetical protein